MTTTRLPDKSASRAVLIGVGDYSANRAAADIPAAGRNVDRLHALLTDDEYGVLAPDGCLKLTDPSPHEDDAPTQILRAVTSAAKEAEELLLVYYCGHGFRHKSGELYLLQAAASADFPWVGSLRFSDLHEELRKARARNRVLIIDCCFSGLAAQMPLGGPQASAELALDQLTSKFGGSDWYILTSGGIETSGAEGENGYTIFTGRLIGVLEDGIEPDEDGDAPEYLDVETLFGRIETTLAALGADQEPRILARPPTTGHGRVAVARNRAWSSVDYAWWPQHAISHLNEWIGTGQVEGRDELTSAVAAIAVNAAKICRRTESRNAEDPWRSPDFTERCASILHDIVSPAIARKALILSPPEAALLAVLPFVYAGWWDAALSNASAEIQEAVEAVVRRESADLVAEDAATESVSAADNQPTRTAPEAADSTGPRDIPATGPVAPPGYASDLRADAAAGRDSSPDDFPIFLGRFGSLVGRALSARARNRPDIERAIWWWLYRSWIPGQCLTTRRPDPLDDVIGLKRYIASARPMLAPRLRELVQDTFGSDCVKELLKALLSDPDPSAKLGARPAGSNNALRTDLIGKIALVAWRMAVEPTRLPGVVEHLNAEGGLNVSELRSLKVKWLPFPATDTPSDGNLDAPGMGQTLHVECYQQAVDLLLRNHCAELDAFALRLAPPSSGYDGPSTLRSVIPLRFTAPGVGPSKRDDGKPFYEFSGTRFGLDGDSTRELFMADRLYGDPALAYRELFQNALDACRMRDKRIEYLTKSTGGGPRDWIGSITFRDGIEPETGRAYVECQDNGVGMGRRELIDLFARSGTRFATSDEYLREQARWRQYNVELQPNSRFGIGVFSYFMIAESIRVVTCRFGPDGHQGDHLQIDIAGPGALFEFTTLPTAHETYGGTTVRLYLKPGVTASTFTDLLRRVIWYCDYDLTAVSSSANDTFILKAGELSDDAPIGARDPFADEAIRSPEVRIEPATYTDTTRVWWCSGRGGVLCDGVWIGTPLYGAVVNLTGAAAPELTVDRRQPLRPAQLDLTATLEPHIDELLGKDDSVFSPAWLIEVAQDDLRLADTIFDRAAASGWKRWSIHGSEVDIKAVGCFTPEIRQEVDQQERSSLAHPWGQAHPRAAWAEVAKRFKWNNHHNEWRARAWVKTGQVPTVRLLSPEDIATAYPSDAVLLGLEDRTSRPSFAIAGVPNFARPSSSASTQKHVAYGSVLYVAASEGFAVPAVIARLHQLGYDTVDVDDLPSSYDHKDIVLLRRELGKQRIMDEKSTWISRSERINAARVFSLAVSLRLSPDEIRFRFKRLGFRLTANGERVGRPDPVDQSIIDYHLSANYIREYSFADAREISRLSNLRPVVVWRHFKSLGLRPRSRSRDGSDRHKCNVCHDDLGSGRLSFAHAVHIALDRGVSLHATVERLSSGGLRPPAEVSIPDIPESIQHSFDISKINHLPWPSERPLTAAEIIRFIGPWRLIDINNTIQRFNDALALSAKRLESFGFDTSIVRRQPLELDDITLIRHNVNQFENHITHIGILLAARHAGITLTEAFERLRSIGAPIAKGLVISEDLDAQDRIIFSNCKAEDIGLSYQFSHDPVPVQRILVMAYACKMTPRAVRERLERLGCIVPPTEAIPDTTSPLDPVILYVGEESYFPELPIGRAPLPHILRAAAAADVTPKQVADRLVELGYGLPEDVEFFEE